tara:strand:- start:12 stop:839 length:828 start_codon:yes stop_codon:yes gene_type:complete
MARYSNIDGGWEGVGNLNEDPFFCSPDSGDFKLAENSPCNGSGENGDNMGAFNVGCNTIITPPEFSLLIPENNFQLVIDQSNQDQYLRFNWEEVIGNIDSLTYTFSIQNNTSYNDTIETNEVFLEIPYEYFISLYSDTALMRTSFYWDVSVSNLDTNSTSLNGPFVLFVEVSDLLLKNNITLPSEYKLHQNYPNPFNPITKIRYDLPKDEFVNITIHDLIGRNIKLIVNHNQSAGYHSLRWDATNNYGENVPAGIYIYTIQVGVFTQTKKMVLIK